MAHFGNEFTMILYLTDAANSSKTHRCVCPTGMLGVSGREGLQGTDGVVGYDNAGQVSLQ